MKGESASADPRIPVAAKNTEFGIEKVAEQKIVRVKNKKTNWKQIIDSNHFFRLLICSRAHSKQVY